MTVIDSPAELAGAKVLILGLGLLAGGTSMTRYCARNGARLRITDLRTAAGLAPALESLRDVDAEYVLGEHREADVDWADIVIRNPAIPPGHPLLRRAREQGKPVDMEMAYFIRHCPARLLAVTGTKGKTSTTSALHEFLRASNPAVALAGNMGTSAIDLLDDLSAADEVLLEVSSFQLEGLRDAPGRAGVAVITNVDDDHLDRYGTIEEYRAVKASIGAGQTEADWLIVPAWDERLIRLCAHHRSKKVYLHGGMREPSTAGFGQDAVHAVLAADRVVLRHPDGGAEQVADLSDLRLLGAHNRLNVAFAAVAAHLAGRSAGQITDIVKTLEPVPHRLAPAGSIGRLEFINDSAASAPVAVVAALDALTGRTPVVITGGDDKAADFAAMITALKRADARVVVLPGTVRARLMSALRVAGFDDRVTVAESMPEAVERAYEIAQSEPEIDVIVLSPGFSSHSVFINEFDRGDQFCAAAEKICAG